MHPTPVAREPGIADLAMLHGLHASLHACLVLMPRSSGTCIVLATGVKQNLPSFFILI